MCIRDRSPASSFPLRLGPSRAMTCKCPSIIHSTYLQSPCPRPGENGGDPWGCLPDLSVSGGYAELGVMRPGERARER
eukprot:4894815-Prymnesium_polylepis.2